MAAVLTRHPTFSRQLRDDPRTKHRALHSANSLGFVNFSGQKRSPFPPLTTCLSLPASRLCSLSSGAVTHGAANSRGKRGSNIPFRKLRLRCISSLDPVHHSRGSGNGDGQKKINGPPSPAPSGFSNMSVRPRSMATWQEKILSVTAGTLMVIALCLAKPGMAAAWGFAKNKNPSPAAASQVSEAEKPSSPAASTEQQQEAKSATQAGGETAKKKSQEKRLGALNALTERVLGEGSEDTGGLKALLGLNLQATNFASCLKILDRLAKLEPAELEWIFVRGQVEDMVGDLEKAQRTYQEILAVDPFSARAMQGLAMVMQRNGQHSLVLKMLEDSILKAGEAGRQAEKTNLTMLLGQMHTMQGNMEAALEQYQAVIVLDPEDYRPYLCQGLVYTLMGQVAKAEEKFEQFRKLSPESVDAVPYIDKLLQRAKVEALRKESLGADQEGSESSGSSTQPSGKGRKSHGMEQPTM